MKVAVVTWSARRVGGVESYLSLLPAAFAARGHQASLWYETDGPSQRSAIAWDAGPTWSVEQLGRRLAVESLRAWNPDVIYAHGLTDPGLEREVVAIAPAVLFGHGYYGTCISGTKTFMTPTPRPCARRFGAACFLHYYPHRCGGLNPVTMVGEFQRQSARRSALSAYRVVATASDHMRREFERHGARSVRTIGLPVGTASHAPRVDRPAERSVRLLFAGRMESTKGGDVLLAALPEVRRQLARAVTVTLLGDGPARGRWASLAGALALEHPDITTRFTGWVAEAERDAAMADADLFVLPSIWPEPFGLSGVEAATRALPTAAFAVGGIPEWLTDGVSGHLAPGNPPGAAGLARAIVACLQDPAHYAALRRGALAASQAYGLDAHMDRLIALLNSVA